MLRLIPFELEKIFRKKSFLLSILLLLAVNVFLLFYTTLPSQSRPPLTAYCAFHRTISGMTESEKADFIKAKKETMDGISFVQEILGFQNLESEMGDTLLKETLAANPGVFEKYHDLYNSNGYLEFAQNPEQEEKLLEEIYDEWLKTSGYGEYLTSIQEKKNTLNGISIFKEQLKPSFASRNIEKSAADYARLTDENICFHPSRPVTLAMENNWTDILLFLSVFLLAGNLILEEKSKKLFYITRSTKKGLVPNILARLTALLISCAALTLLFYGVNLLFSGCTMGLPRLDARLQSLSPYMESSLPLTILSYIAAAICTKMLVFFGIGALLTALCILAKKALLPYLAGFFVWGISFGLYLFIPAGSPAALLKYCNPEGFLKTGFLYGGCLNFNVFGFPVSSLALAWIGILLLTTGGTVFSILAFLRSRSLELKKLQFSLPSWMGRKTNGGLFAQECYKLLIAAGALPVLLLFTALLCGRALDHSYRPSASEEYYRTILLRLEGPCTSEKETLILSEQKKYEEAFARIEQIDNMVAGGSLSRSAGEDLKTKWYAITAFYPAFTRIWNQYENIRETKGPFIYDTGWLYLFGKMDDRFLMDFLLITLCLIFSFSSAVSIEYQSGAIQLISASKTGRRKVFIHKILVCSLFAALPALLTFLCRGIRISPVYPLHEPGCPIQNIPFFQDFPIKIPVGVFALGLLLLQMTAAAATALTILLLGRFRKNHIQTLFFSLLILAVPLLLKLLGFSAAGWFSFYLLYG